MKPYWAKILFVLIIAFTTLGSAAAYPAHGFAAQAGDASDRVVSYHPQETFSNYLPMIVKNQPASSIFSVEMYSISEYGGLDQMKAAGLSWVRRNALRWPEVEAVQGVYNWNALDTLETELINAYQNGIRVILIVSGTPSWAQKHPPYSCGPIRNDPGLAGFDAFAAFLRQVVLRYSVPPYNVRYFEIWNEPDSPYIEGLYDVVYGCWGDPDDAYYGGGYYGEMLKTVYPVIKAANPRAQVLLGGLLLDCKPGIGRCPDERAPKFLEGILLSGAAASFDGISYHAYDYYAGYLGGFENPMWGTTWDREGPVSSEKAGYIRSVLDRYGVAGKYLMNTESAIICGVDGNEPACKTSDYYNTKAIYVTKAYVQASSDQLRANSWYSVYGWRGSGLINLDGSPQPAYNAYAFARSRLGSAVFKQMVSLDPQVQTYEFQRSDRRIWVLWSQDGFPHNLSLSGSPSAAWQWDSSSGAYQPLSPSPNITVDMAPLYLEWVP